MQLVLLGLDGQDVFFAVAELLLLLTSVSRFGPLVVFLELALYNRPELLLNHLLDLDLEARSEHLNVLPGDVLLAAGVHFYHKIKKEY